MAVMRLDRYISRTGIATRSEIKKHIKQGEITLNGSKVFKPDIKIDTDRDKVFFKDTEIKYQKYVYYMLNKPAGVLSATRDKKQKTVLDLINSPCKDIFPVGRLDKDTVGLLVITNDGDLAHKLLSPKKHVNKTYEAILDGPVDDEIIAKFEKGIKIDEDFTALPAKLQSIDCKNNYIRITIQEGKFHQIKRMFRAVDLNVKWLKRISMGRLELDNALYEGEYRDLTEAEINLLRET